MQDINNSQENSQSTPQPINPKSRFGLVLIIVGLLIVTIVSLIWLFGVSTGSPVGFGWFLFAFASGLSMIVLPCTFPLAFVIVPLVAGKGYKKGLAFALAFSLGVVITLSMYGILAAVLGKAVFAFSDAGGETVKNIFYALAGVVAILFGLSEAGLIKFKMPSFSGGVPNFIQNRSDLWKPLLLGLFLGNIGVGCPHPATPILLGQIGITADIFYGWLLFFVHAIGRVVPLLVIAMFAIIGINATKSLIKHRTAITKATAWGMIIVGAFIFTLGFFSHDWWVNSGQHSVLETFTQEKRFTDILAQRLEVPIMHGHGIETGTGFFGLPLAWGNWAFVLLIVLPLWWYWFSERKKLRALAQEQRSEPERLLRWKFWFFVTLSLFLGLLFIYTLPHWFLQHKALENQHEEEIMMEEMMEGEDIMPHIDEEGAPPHGHE